MFDNTKRFLDFLYPRRCPVCDEPVDIVRISNKRLITGDIIHPKCYAQIKPVKGNVCMKCGKPLGKEHYDDEYCKDCQKITHVFDRGFSVFCYRSISGSIYRFKYMGRQEYAAFYADEAYKRLGKTIKRLGVEALIPVPMYEKKKEKRGYNQAEVLAKFLSEKFEIPVYENVIKRTVNTQPMKELTLRQRRNNLKKAFNIVGNDVKFKCILVIDDIYTTGSTIDEIAHEFRIAGTKRIYFLTLAIGQTT